jgi:hypothetical protein
MAAEQIVPQDRVVRRESGEELPDHSSLTRIRKRYGLTIFRRFVEAI